MAKKELDLLQDKPASAILKFAVPMLIGALFQQVYSLVDTVSSATLSTATRWRRWAPAASS